MIFEWDEAKHARNIRERGFGFRFASKIFGDPVLEREDRREDYGETRVVAIGEYRGVILVVTYTERSGVRRIISARRANRKERLQWQLFVGP